MTIELSLQFHLMAQRTQRSFQANGFIYQWKENWYTSQWNHESENMSGIHLWNKTKKQTIIWKICKANVGY